MKKELAPQEQWLYDLVISGADQYRSEVLIARYYKEKYGKEMSHQLLKVVAHMIRKKGHSFYHFDRGYKSNDEVSVRELLSSGPDQGSGGQHDPAAAQVQEENLR